MGANERWVNRCPCRFGEGSLESFMASEGVENGAALIDQVLGVGVMSVGVRGFCSDLAHGFWRDEGVDICEHRDLEAPSRGEMHAFCEAH